jgi:predicted nucleotidyltransferase
MTSKSFFGLPEITYQKIQLVFSAYPDIEKVLIYGSRAKGNYRPGSDIDLTLVGSDCNSELLSRLLVDLDELNTPYLFDVSIMSDIDSKQLLEHIKRVGIVFYQRA